MLLWQHFTVLSKVGNNGTSWTDAYSSEISVCTVLSISYQLPYISWKIYVHNTESDICLTVDCVFLNTFYFVLHASPPLPNSSAQALCLSDEPRAVKEYRYPEKLPGELYDADTQCKWQFGEKAKLCTLDFKKVKLIVPCHANLEMS